MTSYVFRSIRRSVHSEFLQRQASLNAMSKPGSYFRIVDNLIKKFSLILSKLSSSAVRRESTVVQRNWKSKQKVMEIVSYTAKVVLHNGLISSENVEIAISNFISSVSWDFLSIKILPCWVDWNHLYDNFPTSS